MTDTTQKPSRELTMKDFFREENGKVIPVDWSVLIDFKDGDIVEGEVVRIDRDEVLVDIGYKSEGLVPSNELTIRKGADPHDVVELGQRLEALVMQKEDADGRLILSAKRAAFERAWEPHRRCLQRPAHRRGTRDRGGQRGPDPGHRAAGIPACQPRRHQAREEPRLVLGPEARMQGYRVEPEPQQRSPFQARRARRGAQGGARAHPDLARGGHDRQGHRLQPRGFRGLRRPGRHRRSYPHLRTLLAARRPPQ